MQFKVFLFLALGALTLADVRFDFRYDVVGPDIVINDWQFSKKNQGFIAQSWGELTLASSDKTKKISIYKRLGKPENTQNARLSADIACREVIRGDNSAGRALLYLIQYDENGKSLRTDRIAAALDGTRPWRFYKKVFRLSEDAVRLKVGAQLNRCTGELKIRNTRLTPLVSAPYSLWIKGLMIFAWGLFYCSLVKDYAGFCSTGARGILVLCFAVILVGTTIPDEARDWVMKWAGVDLSGGGLASQGIGGLAWDEWIHFFGFVVFGAVLVILTPEIPLWMTCLCLCMCAFGTEMMQVFVESRTPKVFDGLINTVGWLFGSGLAAVRKQGFLTED